MPSPSPPRRSVRPRYSAAPGGEMLHTPDPPRMRVKNADDQTRIHLFGDWLLGGVAGIDAGVRQTERTVRHRSVSVDFSCAGRIDTSGALLIERLRRHLEDNGCSVAYVDPGPERQVLLEAVGHARQAGRGELGTSRDPSPLESLLVLVERVGRGAAAMWNDCVAAMFIIGSAVHGSHLRSGRAGGVSAAAIVKQMDHMGVRAAPIIALISLLVGGIVAQQSAFQLRYFGTEVFAVDLVGVLQLREIGTLLTAVMVAGRSGSSITAEIGSMKMREEVDALKVMGLNPVAVLVFPKLVALTVVLPALVIIANFAALTGAMLTLWVYSGIPPDTFLDRLGAIIDVSTVASGMIKAPFMALIIGIASSIEGFKVGGSTESLGRRVTAAVVKSIFVVMLADGLFVLFFAAIDF